MYKIKFKAQSQPDLTITDDVYNKNVKSKGEDEGFEIQGVYYPFDTVKNIQKISAVKKARPNIVPKIQFNKKIVNRIKALEQMIEGLKKYIKSSNYQGGEAPLLLLKQWENKLRELLQSSKN